MKLGDASHFYDNSAFKRLSVGLILILEGLE